MAAKNGFNQLSRNNQYVTGVLFVVVGQYDIEDYLSFQTSPKT